MPTVTASKGKRNTRRHAWKIWALYALGFVPAGVAFYQGATGGLGADPVKSFEHLLGIWALRFLILTLLITPLRQIGNFNLVRYRRALGLLAFYYALMHFAAYMLLDQALDFPAIMQDITRRPFITIGMVSLALLIPLALTSNNWAIRKLGRRWSRLHKLVYIAIAGGALHFILSTKGWQAEPVIYAFIVAALLAWRVVRQLIRR
ncbi:protein-methionine-sulfoxide reductase heme-binding subunit MsrQ [Falsochrobactrum ovis]|uniref:Protein-methionine-sulfoxide reductase heme-binding subunit MsrQ n=1 Tax=Falsochrobactrum ovis TaxID=1293442 RepID=A0A364JUG6_9HYPH|nr:protein-methionine-sulfoxide reductase heme-binding subunit MsrQ [Falsochrobactrum ovis]RAK28148.1 sulfoxide reductase heme-binding subunit YedZ [Falsochrobactrum ovis]